MPDFWTLNDGRDTVTPIGEGRCYGFTTSSAAAMRAAVEMTGFLNRQQFLGAPPRTVIVAGVEAERTLDGYFVRVWLKRPRNPGWCRSESFARLSALIAGTLPAGSIDLEG